MTCCGQNGTAAKHLSFVCFTPAFDGMHPVILYRGKNCF